MSTEEILLTLALALVVVLSALHTLLLRTTLDKVLQTLERVHIADIALQNKTLDRLMARDFQEYKAYESLLMEGEVTDQSDIPSDEQPTAEFPAQYPPPRDAPLVRGERWVPPEERGIDPEEVTVEDR